MYNTHMKVFDLNLLFIFPEEDFVAQYIPIHHLVLMKLSLTHSVQVVLTVDSVNPIALRQAKTLLSFDLSECNRV